MSAKQTYRSNSTSIPDRGRRGPHTAALRFVAASFHSTSKLFAALLLMLVILPTPPSAAPYSEHQTKRPELFDPETGYRIARQRAATPDDIPPPAQLIGPEDARALLDQGALAIDVFGAAQSRFDELDGTWLVSEPRLSLPGAVWLPETGRGTLTPVMQAYLFDNLAALTNGNLAQPIVIFCIADCWMSWNAAQRIAAAGYSQVYWFRLGTDGWQDIGAPLFPVAPIPVQTD
ncbi:PQQ-dependent catabolism-associated CXXCW motif protein [Marivita hallyeonensis]|nr:PQQ-dependent catabolism-associated CXXCW motif protein [Marivita hallyeonensis]